MNTEELSYAQWLLTKFIPFYIRYVKYVKDKQGIYQTSVVPVYICPAIFQYRETAQPWETVHCHTLHTKIQTIVDNIPSNRWMDRNARTLSSLIGYGVEGRLDWLSLEYSDAEAYERIGTLELENKNGHS
jgi:hypothetical protein